MGSCCTKLHRDDVVSPDEEKLVEARSGGEARGEYGSTALASTAIATTTDSGPRPPSKRPDKPSTVEESGLVRIKFGAAGERSKCAYCDREDGDLFDYIFCPEMGLDLLEGLMERGWWRTGHVIFKPRSREVCCPTYTTRMQPTQFVPHKSHRRVLRRWTEFLLHGDSRWSSRTSTNGAVALSHDLSLEAKQTASPTPPERVANGGDGGRILSDEPSLEKSAGHSEERAEDATIETGKHGERVQVNVEIEFSQSGTNENVDAPEIEGTSPPEVSPCGAKQKTVTPGVGADPDKPRATKAKKRRAQKRLVKLSSQDSSGADQEDGAAKSREGKPKAPPVPSSLLELFDAFNAAQDESFKHSLSMKLLCCQPRDEELTDTLEAAYALYDKFQESVHLDKTRFHSMEEFEQGFYASPVTRAADGFEGTYHIHYYIDGELEMVNVVDIFPRYFVTIYCFYNPQLRFMQPGIFSGLHEIDLVLRMQREHPSLIYYALGYYSPFNSKISYKSQFDPQELLCNETDVYVPLEAVVAKIKETPYCRLVEDNSVPEKEGRSAPIDDLVVRTSRGHFQFRDLPERKQNKVREPLRALISEVGSSIAHQFAVIA